MLPFVYAIMGQENMYVSAYFCKRNKRGMNQKLMTLVIYGYQELGWEQGGKS